MSQQLLPLRDSLSSVDKNDNISIKSQQKPKKIVGSPVTNKFFIASVSSLPLKPIMNKLNNKTREFSNQEVIDSRIISSEDVSRKKLKLDEKYRKKRYNYSTLQENDDLLENLKKKFDKESMSQPVLREDVQTRQKSQRRKRPLFTDESLNLMNNFKKYFKDNILQDLSDQSISKKSNINKSSITLNQENIDNQINPPANYNSFSSNYRTPSRQFNVVETTPSNCSTVLVKDNDLFSRSTFQYKEVAVQDIFSPLRTPDFSFKSKAIMVDNLEDHTNQIGSLKLPQADISSFQYSYHAGKRDANNQDSSSYF